jgi:dihydroorotase
MLNIVGSGMKGGPVEQNLSDMDPNLTALRAAEFPRIVVGVKVAHYRGAEWDPVDRAVKAGERAGIPVMVDFGGHDPPLSLEALLLTHLRPGDILTHTYADVDGRIPIVDQAGILGPYVRKARERGIVFDVGHGAGSFVFRQARAAMEQGFPPDTISTDLHRASMNGGMKDMLNVISKLLSLEMPLEDAVRAATSSAARAIRRDDIGHLAIGAGADIAVLSVREGKFGFVDVAGERVEGTRKLECELTIRGGKMVWDLNGISAAPER